MDLLSSLLIPVSISGIGLAMLICLAADKIRYNNYSAACLLISIWLIADITIDFITTGLEEYWSASDSTLYYYLFAITSLMILYRVVSKPALYQLSLKRMFMAITFLCVPMAMFRWFAQSRWEVGGAEFYYSYGIMLDSAFVFSILAMDSLMIILGVYSALATSTNTNNSIRSERR